MIELVKGNLLEANAEALINTVNTVGVMGKGIALQFRQGFSQDYFKDYQKAAHHGEIKIGKMHVFPTGQLMPRYLINFPTKRHWRGKSKIEDIKEGLIDLIKVVKNLQIKSIAIPPLGCGNGGLNWKDVRPLIENAFAETPETKVLLYIPSGAPKAEKMKVATKRPNMTAVRAALLLLFDVYLLPGYRLSQLEIQKLAYFLQVSGEPLQLNFVKDKYGPYAEVLNHVLQRIEGHFIRGYGDRTQKIIEPTIFLMPEALEEAQRYLDKNSPETIKNLENVFRLIEGFEYPNGMELLSTVHWVTQENEFAKNDLNKTIELVHRWNDRKKEQFSERDIGIAWTRLKKCNYC